VHHCLFRFLDPAFERFRDLEHIACLDVARAAEAFPRREDRSGLQAGETADLPDFRLAAVRAASRLRRHVVDPAIIENLEGMDPCAAVGTLNLNVDALADLRELGKRAVLADVQPFAADLDASLPRIDLFDESSCVTRPIRSRGYVRASRALKKPLFARVPAVGIGMRNPTDRDW